MILSRLYALYDPLPEPWRMLSFVALLLAILVIPSPAKFAILAGVAIDRTIYLMRMRQ